ncbi:hypothetical protein DERF_013558 [Dermatophagoides farinae]|uniref:Uncharacterized protein n=1 Tax=Dermatophagoides farinae TaxID=6954 RepID=A0A922L0P0_DERFA|nr:hypothetical protein DERF_013558 [Dermatophagoides farinae]
MFVPIQVMILLSKSPTLNFCQDRCCDSLLYFGDEDDHDGDDGDDGDFLMKLSSLTFDIDDDDNDNDDYCEMTNSKQITMAKESFFSS